ncbi:MAG: hypothetical protein ACTHNS_14000 [Marmoricola sp.]
MRLTPTSPWPFVGLGALACLAFLIGASVQFLPWWGVLLLAVAWLLLTIAGSVSFSAHPRRVLPLAVVGYLLWLMAVALAALGG